MKVILIKDVAKLGQRGKIIEVADSYAINVLIPKGLALLGTPTELAKWKQKEENTKFKKELAINTFAQLVNKIRSEKIVIEKKKHEHGHLFAQIKEVDIVDAIYNLTHFSLDPKQIIIKNQIKTIGKHTIFLKQGNQIEEIGVEIK